MQELAPTPTRVDLVLQYLQEWPTPFGENSVWGVVAQSVERRSCDREVVRSVLSRATTFAIYGQDCLTTFACSRSASACYK